MTQDDTFLSRFKAPAPPSAVDETVLAAAHQAASRLKAGNVGRPEAVVGAKKSYDGETKGKAGANSGAGESAMETITFPYPACGTKYSVPAQHAGKSTPCKKCGANITVPMPQVANPTIIGGTRTIRRSDIEDASTSERAAPVMKKATAPVPKVGMKKATANFGDVDMKGGESVLRKEETVVQTGHGTRPNPSRVPPPPARGARPVPGGRPAPAPGQPGFGAPKAKNPMPLYLGIGGGVLLVVIVAIIFIMPPSNKPGTNPGNSGGGGGGTGSGAAVQVSEDEKILKQFENDTRNEIGMLTAAVRENYKVAKEKAAAGGKFVDKFKDYKNQFASLLGRRMAESGANKKDVRDVGIMLHGDGYTDIARPLLEQARKMMGAEDRYRTVTENVTGPDGQPSTRKKSVIRDDYKQICDILGYMLYSWPEEEFSEYYMWELAEYRPWEEKRQQLMSENGDDLFFTKAQIDEIKALENALSKAGQELRAQDKKDGFAIQARKAFIRFREKNKDGSKYADFSPSVLGREGEKFDDVWDYTYWKPFIVYVEKAPGRTASELRKDFAAKANLLMRLEQWFRKNLIEKFDLKRVLPLDGPKVITEGPLKGKKFETTGELAEAEGWPLEVNVLKDGQTFQLFLEAKMGGGIPGARAFYSNPLKHVVTWDDPRAAENDEQAWFNESVLIHECFHMLSDHYAAKPIPWDFKKERDAEGVRRKNWFPTEERARYFNVFIQEGLTDSVAGFSKKSDAEDTEYHFLVSNQVRIKDWQGIYKNFENNNLFRIRDLLDCVHYGHFTSVGHRCWDRIGMRKKMGGYPRDSGMYFGIYYAAACQASAFFFHYKENGTPKYRDKWMEYVKKNYTGAVELTDYSPEPGIKMFKECFGIKSDDDFDKMEAELVKWTLQLQPDGSDGLIDKDYDSIGDAPDVPGPGSYAPRANEQWAALREEEAMA